MKLVIVACIGVFALNLSACSKADEKNNQPPTQKAKFRDANKFRQPFHGDMETASSATSDSIVLASLKKNHLEVSSTKTIGEALDSYKYAVRKEWRETSTRFGPYYVDYIFELNIKPISALSLKEGVVRRMVVIKFAVQEDGETSVPLADRVDIKSDGMRYTTHLATPEIQKMITAIYENREIVF